MRRLRLFGLASMAMFVVGVMTAAAASAESTPLPDIHTALPGETYPLHLQGTAEQTVEGDISLKTTITKLPAESVAVLLLVSELTSLGLALIAFRGFHETASAVYCNTAGDATGVVLVPNAEFHLVYTGLSPSEVLAIAGLILFPTFEILCNAGEVKIEVMGPLMVRTIPGPTASGDSTSIELATHCVGGANQELSSYFNDKLELVKEQLLKANISGTGFGRACEEVKPTVLLNVLEEKMFTVLE